MSREIRKIFGIAIAATYAYTIFLSTSWIVAMGTAMARFTLFATIALAILYLHSYCGEECVIAVRLIFFYSLNFFFKELCSCGRCFGFGLAFISNRYAEKAACYFSNESETVVH